MANSVPTLTGLTTPVTFLENTVNATPQIIDADVTFTDADNNFNGGALTVTGLLAEDTVAIRNQGVGAGQIGVAGTNVSFGGTVIGSFTGGAGGTLTVTFNASATAAGIDALIQNLTYANSSDAPTASHNLEFKVSDAAGFAAIAPLAFAAQTGAANPFGGVNVVQAAAPSFADLDGDGDLDAFVGSVYGTLRYFENTGTANAPIFAEQTGSANPFNGVDVGFRSKATFADLDGDGDLDVVVGETYGNLFYFEDTGSAIAPAFTARTGAANPFNGVDVGRVSAQSLVDLDGDGDFDAVVGNEDGVLFYFKNTGSALAPVFTQQTGAANPFNGVDVGLDSAPSFVDLDGDGDLDALVGTYAGTLNYFENTGSAIAPAFTARTGAANPFNGVDVGRISTPSFADLDGDGHVDAVVGAFDGGTLNYFRNTTPHQPAPDFAAQTGAANPFNGVDVGNFSTPVFADLDGDGDLDALVGENGGTLRYFENTGTVIAPAFTERTGAANPFDGVDVAFNSSPSFADLDGDGDLDAVIGAQDGTLHYFQNTGSAIVPTFAEQTGAANPFSFVDVGTRSTPSFVDLDGDGDLDAVVGEEYGTLHYFENTGSAVAPAFTELTGAANPFDGVDVGFNARPSFADLDGDGDLDAVVGASDGTVHYFENTGSATAPAFSERTGAANPFDGIDVGVLSKPSFADLDGDGDLDVLVGEQYGALFYFENTGAGFVQVVDVTAQDDPAVAQDDAVATTENTAITAGNVFADNGSGPDTDPDSTFLVTAVSGGTLGTQFTLPSGALLTLNADGTFSYDPNHAFDKLPAPGSGASNLTTTDTFSYTATGGDTAIVTVTITGVDSNDTLLGTAGNDNLSGGIGNDLYMVGNTGDAVNEAAGAGYDIVAASADYTLPANVEALYMIGAGLTGTGSGNADTLLSSGGPNTLIGLGGDDRYYVNNVADVVTEAVGGGLDTVLARVNYTLPANVEALYLIGSGLTGTGSGNADTLLSSGGPNTLIGLGGNDLYYINNAADVVTEAASGGSDTVVASVNYALPANVEALYLIGSGLTGTGSGNADTLLSSGGPNTLIGLGGDDLYYVNNSGDVVTEAASGGFDTVIATASYALPANVEALFMIGSGLTGTGSGNADTLLSSGGPNTLVGLGGDDLYVIGNSADVVTEDAGGGSDTVLATANYTLPANVEALYMIGSGLTGTGSGNADTLLSSGGPNTLIGLGGDDFYYVGNSADVVTEAASGGYDTVVASVSFTLSSNVEALFMIGSGLTGTGSGNADTLLSSGGPNTLIGLGGDDTYYVGNSADVVTEAANGGYDTVLASVSFTLSSNVEALYVNGSGLTGTGNSGANTLVSLGANTLLGGGGNDMFVFLAGSADGATVADFDGAVGDVLVFSGFGTAAQGATFSQIGTTDQWLLEFGLDAHTETITLANGAAADTGHFLFV